MRLDHISYAVGPQSLGSTLQRIGSALGSTFLDGGVHPRFGTRNFVLPLAGETYVEVVTALDHPATDRAPFGQAVKQRAEMGGGWLGWVVSVADITPVEQRLGRNAVDGHRVRPDGFELRWKQIGVRDLMDDPQLPFVIQWLIPPAQRPAMGASSPIVSIERLDIVGDPAVVSTWLGESVDHPLEGVKVDWIQGDDIGLNAVHFTTPTGSVCID